MARRRIRSIKPEFFGDEKLVSLSRDARYTMIGLISLADDRGRLRERSLEILGAIYPEESVSTTQLRKWLNAIISVGLALRYEVAGHHYLWLPGFLRHQVVERPTESDLPPHPDDALAERPILDAYDLAKGKDPSTKRRGKVPDKSLTSLRSDRRDVGESSRLTRAGASFPIPSSSNPESPTTGGVGASDLATRIGEACSILGSVPTWLIDPVAVENVEGMYPDIDIVQAARLAVTWGTDQSWELPAAATLRSAAKKLHEEAQRGGKRKSPNEVAAYDARVEVLPT